MKRFLIFLTLLMAFFATSAFAAWYNPVDWVKTALDSGGMTIIAYILTGILVSYVGIDIGILRRKNK